MFTLPSRLSCNMIDDDAVKASKSKTWMMSCWFFLWPAVFTSDTWRPRTSKCDDEHLKTPLCIFAAERRESQRGSKVNTPEVSGGRSLELIGYQEPWIRLQRINNILIETRRISDCCLKALWEQSGSTAVWKVTLSPRHKRRLSIVLFPLTAHLQCSTRPRWHSLRTSYFPKPRAARKAEHLGGVDRTGES